MEIWKTIKDYEQYKVSNLGNVKRNKILKQNTRVGYFAVNLCKNGKMKTLQVHRLVAQAFIPNPNNLPQVNHKDGNKKNNKVENLEWCSAKYNVRHAIKTGLKNFKSISKRVNQLKNGIVINTFNSINEIERLYGFGSSNICKSLKGKIKQAYGYEWEYA